MTRKMLIGTVLASLLAAGGSAFAQPVSDPPAMARFAPPARSSWTSLGEIVVGGRFDRDGDTLFVGRQAGRVGKLRLVLLNGHPIVRAVRVTFGNGETMLAHVRADLLRHGIAEIDLPGAARAIRSVELLAANRGRFDRGRVEVLGERAAPMWYGFNR